MATSHFQHGNRTSVPDGGNRQAAKLIDEYALVYPGVQSVEHVYFYAVHGADDATRRGYLERACALGRDFAPAESVVGAASHA